MQKFTLVRSVFAATVLAEAADISNVSNASAASSDLQSD